MKLQEAYAAERNAVGGWTLIGYTKPASNNFNYAGAVGESATIELNGSLSTIGWHAQNTVALNDCAASSCFRDIALDDADAKGGQINYAACLSTKAAPLTANFTAISTPGKSCTAGTSAISGL